MDMKDHRYNVSLSPKLDEDLNEIAEKLDTTKSEAMRRALVLMRHAIDAKAVKLVDDEGQEQRILIK